MNYQHLIKDLIYLAHSYPSHKLENKLILRAAGVIDQLTQPAGQAYFVKNTGWMNQEQPVANWDVQTIAIKNSQPGGPNVAAPKPNYKECF